MDPSLFGIRKRIAAMIPQGSRVIDVGCGTGAQLFYLSGQIEYGFGVELSETMINAAKKQSQIDRVKNCEFQLADASDLSSLADQSFDFAISSLVIHEMPLEIRISVLKEMSRVGKQVIIADWTYPHPPLLTGLGTLITEFLAGWEHFSNYRSYLRNGGIPALLESFGVNVVETQDTSRGTIQLWRFETENENGL